MARTRLNTGVTWEQRGEKWFEGDSIVGGEESDFICGCAKTRKYTGRSKHSGESLEKEKSVEVARKEAKFLALRDRATQRRKGEHSHDTRRKKRKTRATWWRET